MGAFTLEIPSVEEIQEDLKTELSLEEDEKVKIDASVKEKGDAILALDLDSMAERREFTGSINHFGNEIIEKSQRRNRYLGGRINELMVSCSDGGEIAKSLKTLSDRMKELDPTGIDFVRTGIIGKLFNPAHKYFERYKAADREIGAIIESLDRGRSVLKNDNTTLELEQMNMRKLTKHLNEYIEMGSQLETYLNDKLATLKDNNTDPERVYFIEQEVIFPLSQRVLDFQQMLAVNEQGIIALEVIRKNNLELIRAVDRAKTVTITSLRTAVTVAGALYNQKIVLEKVNALNAATNQMIGATARLLREQGVSVQEQSMNANISPETLKQAFSDAFAALDDINHFRERALPQMRRTIETFKDISEYGERRIEIMERGREIDEDI